LCLDLVGDQQAEAGAVALDGACLRKKCDQDARLGYDLMSRFAQLAVRRLEATQLQLLDLYISKP